MRYQIMRQHELQAAFNKAKAALDDLGQVIERHLTFSPPRSSKLPRGKLCEQILRERPGLDIYEIMEELRRRGCAFSARNPINSIRTTLYKSPRFICLDGRFSLRPEKLEGRSVLTKTGA
jgi:hypothetical protein